MPTSKKSYSKKTYRKKMYKKKESALVKFAGGRSNRPEHKAFDQNVPQGVIDDTGGYYAWLSAVPQGITNKTRIGDGIHMKNLSYKFSCGFDFTGTLNQCVVGVAIVLTSAPIVTGPGAVAWNDVFLTNNPESPILKEVTDTYRILRRHTFTLCKNGQSMKTVEGFINLQSINTEYVDATPTQSNRNSIVVIGTSDAPNASGPPIMVFYPRLTYTDN